MRHELEEFVKCTISEDKRQPNVSYFKIFGYKVHIFILKDIRKKLDSHTQEAIFLDYIKFNSIKALLTLAAEYKLEILS
uniref:Uncharacterized protein n=1 Tax=Physcomitrium patens TaxID=3218 RepID=A0A2K1JL52_PHYPA|nr:hypothetical protein PHYPA_017111 [Physcomitrium patens]